MSPSLSPRPDLKQIKRQAKELLRAQQAGDHSVCPKLRVVPRLSSMTDEEILSVDVGLQEAQHALAKDYGLEALITDDYLEVEAAIAAAAPELILGTQMERHIGKRLGIPCAVISAPVHVQDFPARYSPQMGWEGANVIFDTWVHPLVMGLEEHLLTMFREDFEFHDGAGPSHHGGHAPKPVEEMESEAGGPAPQTPRRISRKMKQGEAAPC